MAPVVRADFGTLGRVERTPSGGLRVPAGIAREGVLRYSDGAREWGEYVPPETLFDDTSMASLRGAPVTDLHPPALVTPETWGEVAVGHVGDDVAAGASAGMLEASVLIQDAAEIRRIEAGERVEVSAGYVCDVEPTPGVYGGEPYEGVQRNRRYNHVALGPAGWARAGASARLRLDGAAIEVQRAVTAQENAVKKKLKIRGREYRLDADAVAGTEDETVKAQDAVTELEGESTKKDQEMAALQSQCQTLQKALTDALSQAAQLQASLAAKEALAAPPASPVTEEQVPEDVLDSALTKRASLHADARAVLGEAATFDGQKPAAIKRAVVAKALPTVKLDGLDDKTVEGLYLAAVAGAKAADAARTGALAKAGHAALPGVRTDHQDGADRSASLQRKLEEQGRAPIFAGGKAS